jgi:hypothetical protein
MKSTGLTVTANKKVSTRTTAADKTKVTPIHKMKESPAFAALQQINYGKPVIK